MAFAIGLFYYLMVGDTWRMANPTGWRTRSPRMENTFLHIPAKLDQTSIARELSFRSLMNS